MVNSPHNPVTLLPYKKAREIAEFGNGRTLSIQMALEDYLDHLCAPLIGVVSFAERQELRLEARSHLEFLVEEYEHTGMTLSEAIRAAIREYGPPDENGQALLAVWWQRSRHRTSQAVQRSGDAATIYAFTIFGIFSAANHYLLQYYLSTPRVSWLYLYMVSLAVVSPAIAGLLVGSLVPARAIAGTVRALALIILHSIVAGALLLPDIRGLLFALFQLFFWLPIAFLCVSGGESLAHRQRHRLIWQRALQEEDTLCHVRPTR